MPKLKNCPYCGKIFAEISGVSACPDCLEKLQKMEKEIVEYVREHPKCRVKEICEATGAKESMIKRMIREGRFIQEGVQMSYPCEKCGTPIFEGKFCTACMDKMREAMQKQNEKFMAARAAAASKGVGMHSKNMQRNSK